MHARDAARRRALTALALLAAGGAPALTGCVAPPEKSSEAERDDQGDTLWPLPPEQPRFVYETALRSRADVFQDDDSARLRRTLTGERIDDDRVFDKPAAVAARGGRIFVSDTVQRSVAVFDVPRRRVFHFGLRTPGQLAKPVALALDGQRRVYVADATLRRVMVYDTLGLFQREIGSPADLRRPTGVAVSDGGERVYVIDRSDNDSDAHRVIAYDGEGRKLREIGTRGRGDGQFNVPVQGTVTRDGTLWVLDAGNFRVQAFDAEGRFLRAFGRVGNGLGQFARPRGIASDADGNLYVTDAAFGNVQIFNPQGQLLLTVGRTGRSDRSGRFGLLTGVAVDETGRMYLVDQLFGKVEVIRRLSDDEGRALAARAAP
jgi:DNA-binding beta-propeller fold protein YncE